MPPAARAFSADSSTTQSDQYARRRRQRCQADLVECETQLRSRKGVECYQRMKDHVPPPGVWTPLSVGIAYAMTDKITADQGSSDHHQPRPDRVI